MVQSEKGEHRRGILGETFAFMLAGGDLASSTLEITLTKLKHAHEHTQLNRQVKLPGAPS
jgi:hypothetical protein